MPYSSLNQIEKKLENVLWKQAQAMAHVGSFLRDMNSGQAHWSDNLFRILGYEPGAAPNTHELFLRHVHVDDRQDFEQAFQEAVRTGQPLETELRFHTKLGEPRWGNYIITPDPGGQPGVVLGSFQDITRRKRAELRLQRAQDMARLGHMERNLDTGETYWSDEVYHILGYEPGEIDPSGLEALKTIIHPDDRDLIVRRLRDIRETLESVDLEYRVLTKDGETIWLHAKGPAVATAKGTRLELVVQEVTARKRMEQVILDRSKELEATVARRTEELHASRERLRHILEHIEDAVWSMDLDSGGMDYLSPSFRDVTGLDPEAVLANTDALLGNAHPEDRDGLRRTLDALARLGADMEMEYRVIGADGRVHWMLIMGGPMDSATGGARRAVGIIRDISERKRHEEAMRRHAENLRQAKEMAESASRAKSEFLANMSHEIRTPLNAMLSCVQLIEDSENLTEDQNELVRKTLDAGWNLLQVINDILDLSKIEAGRMDISLEAVDLRELSASIMRMFKDKAALKKIKLSSDVDVDLPTAVISDPGRLRQILFNLVGNAVKFSERGRVRIEMGVSGPRADDDTFPINLTVVDDGVGIPEDKLASVFEPFTQAESGTSEGTGLGLHIVKRLARLMGGDAYISSQEGVGTSVGVEVRVAAANDQRQGADQGAGTAPEGPERPLRILLAEDNEINSKTLTAYLKRHGHEVTTAFTGRQALTALAKGGFDCVLMDIRMPDMDGLEATRRIRAGEVNGVDPAIPIVAITAYAMKGDRKKFLSQGMDDYVAKPFKMRQLDDVLQGLFARA